MAGAVQVAETVDGAGGAVELDGCFDQAGQEEDEEDEGAEDDDAGEELALLDQGEDYEEEEEGEGAGCDAVGEYPGFWGLVWLLFFFFVSLLAGFFLMGRGLTRGGFRVGRRNLVA